MQRRGISRRALGRLVQIIGAIFVSKPLQSGLVVVNVILLKASTFILASTLIGVIVALWIFCCRYVKYEDDMKGWLTFEAVSSSDVFLDTVVHW